jgi:hypothetical protein
MAHNGLNGEVAVRGELSIYCVASRAGWVKRPPVTSADSHRPVASDPSILAGFYHRFSLQIRKVAFLSKTTALFAPPNIVRDVNRHAWRATEHIA